MSYKYGKYEIPDDVKDLSDIAKPGMDICEFVKEWGTIGSSLVFSEAIRKSTLTDDMKGTAYDILGNLQQSLKLIRETGTCNCNFK